MTRPVVFIFRPVDESGESHRTLAAAGCAVTVAEPGLGPRAMLDSAGDAQALLGATFRGGSIDRAFLEAMPRLRIVAKYTIGVDDVDVDTATEPGFS
jgi:phosphoglycerate dehydrogenase-like enzyme